MYVFQSAGLRLWVKNGNLQEIESSQFENRGPPPNQHFTIKGLNDRCGIYGLKSMLTEPDIIFDGPIFLPLAIKDYIAFEFMFYEGFQMYSSNVLAHLKASCDQFVSGEFIWSIQYTDRMCELIGHDANLFVNKVYRLKDLLRLRLLDRIDVMLGNIF